MLELFSYSDFHSQDLTGIIFTVCHAFLLISIQRICINTFGIWNFYFPLIRGWQRINAWHVIMPKINMWCVNFTERRDKVRFLVFPLHQDARSFLKFVRDGIRTPVATLSLPPALTCTANTAKDLTNRFRVAVNLFSNRSQMMSKLGKNKEAPHDLQLSV